MKKVVELGVESRDGGGTVLQSRSGLLQGEERDDLSGRRQIAQLFAETRTSLYRYLVSIGIRPSQADDVIQEAFVRFYQQLEAGTKIKNPRVTLPGSFDFFIIFSICDRFLCGWGDVIFTLNLVPARPPRFTFLTEADQPSSGRVSI